jgi:hypothetical protein
VFLYQALLVRWPLRSLLVGMGLLGSLLSVGQLLLVTRANVRLGVSDKVGGRGKAALWQGDPTLGILQPCS